MCKDTRKSESQKGRAQGLLCRRQTRCEGASELWLQCRDNKRRQAWTPKLAVASRPMRSRTMLRLELKPQPSHQVLVLWYWHPRAPPGINDVVGTCIKCRQERRAENHPIVPTRDAAQGVHVGAGLSERFGVLILHACQQNLAHGPRMYEPAS